MGRDTRLLFLWYNKSMAKDKKKKNNKSTTGGHVIDIEEAQEERRRKRQEAANKKRKKRKDEKEKLEEIRAQSTPESRKKKRKKAGRTKKILIFIMIVAVLAFVGGAVSQVIKLNLELKDAKEQKEKKVAEQAKMQRNLDRINDPEYIEEQARERLRMIRQGEILYVFPEEVKDNSE